MRCRQTGRIKTGDQSPADIAMRQHRVKYGVEALLRLDMEVDGGECLRADVTCRLVKRDDTAGTNGSCGSPQHRHGITLMVQDVATDRSIELGAFGKCLVRRDQELDPSMSGCERSVPCHLHGAGL